MEQSPKRRKVSHPADSRGSVNIATASPFVLQTEELLKEVKVDYVKALSGADSLLHKIKNLIDGIESHGPVPIAEATRKFQKTHRIKIPYPDPKPADDAPYKLSYEKPSAYNVVGSYVSKTMVKAQTDKGVDMIVRMPATMFQEKDHRDMRYFYRRAYYIAMIAASLRKELGGSAELEFEYLNGNALLPVLSMRPVLASDGSDDANDDNKKQPTGPSKKEKADYIIRIIPCAPEGILPKAKLHPAANSNRSGQSESAKDASAATPFYNSTLKAEDTFVTYLRVLTKAKTECAAFVDACVLGRIWLQQRGLGSSLSKGGFGHFEWAIMTALLLQTGGRNGQPALSSALSSTELFKATVQFLASTEFSKKPFIFGTYKNGADIIRENGPVMFDPEREVNILYKMSPWSASLLHFYACTTMEVLNDTLANQFEPTFITKADMPLQLYDAIFEIRNVDSNSKNDSADRRGAVWDLCFKANTVLKKALKERSQLIHFQSQDPAPWPVTGSGPGNLSNIQVGIIFDPANMGRLMEYGPSAELEKEAAKFRKFWGERAELRRFQDGSILECVQWVNKTAAGICEEIVRYVLQRHLSLSAGDLRFHDAELPASLGISPLDREAFEAARKAFGTLEQDIRGLEDMPLSVRQISPIAPELRSASVKPPFTASQKTTPPPMDVNLYFEASSKWPENLVAIQETKIEFLLDIDRRLRAVNDNITTSLGRDNTTRDIDNLAYLDIVYETGAAFRLRIFAELEETLLDRQAKNKTLDPQTRVQAEEALFDLNWQYKHLPLHSQTVTTYCTRFTTLSTTIRIVKQWFNAHKLAGHISEELIELLVLRVFLHPHPWKTPSSTMSGFLRTLLFLSRWDWRDEPLVVDSSDDMSADDRAIVQRHLEAWRTRDPNMNHAVLFVATPHDHAGLAYTRRGPSKLLATRMTRLAKAATKLIRDEGIALDPSRLFHASLGDYDVTIHLSTSALKRVVRDAGSEAGTRHSLFKNLDERTGQVPLPLGRPPATVLLRELEVAYEDTLIFFHGAPDDAVIGAIWQPKLRRQNFRVGLPYNFRQVEDGEEDADVVEVNKPAVLLEIARIGGELIKRIEVSQ
ncbi:U3 small nucleolar RNA-associated protein 22 [Colletotrichum chlorophyti]|uniref:U3 small nucleolar RNA-associated protein 22 n=1 Tax=Colletotrichum chlorophyti TaxID=708187 RepID=A0A1Q8S111_9PEZI|nr:U3 small nucleolar RNA-associated protein 22 [Colletotrichum chlorophyti]